MPYDLTSEQTYPFDSVKGTNGATHTTEGVNLNTADVKTVYARVRCDQSNATARGQDGMRLTFFLDNVEVEKHEIAGERDNVLLAGAHRKGIIKYVGDRAGVIQARLVENGDDICRAPAEYILLGVLAPVFMNLMHMCVGIYVTVVRGSVMGFAFSGV